MAREFGDSSLEFATLAYLGASLVARRPRRRGHGAASTRRWPRSRAATSTTSPSSRRSSASCSRPASTPTTSTGPTSGSGSARRSRPVATCRRWPRSAGRTTAGCSPRPDGGAKPTPRSATPCASGVSATARCARARSSAWPTCGCARAASRRPSSCSTGLDDDVEAARPLAAVHLVRGEPSWPSTSSNGRCRRSTARASRPRRCGRCSSTLHLAGGDIDDAADDGGRQLDACADAAPEPLPAGHRRAGPRPGLPGRRRRATPCALPARGAVRASRRPGRRWSWPRPGSSWPTALAADRPEVALAEARAALDGFERLPAARHADAAAALLRSLGGRATGPAATSGACSPSARPRCSSCSATACRTPRSPIGSTSAARPSSTTSATSWPSSACASRAEAAAYAVRAETSRRIGDLPDAPDRARPSWWSHGRSEPEVRDG